MLFSTNLCVRVSSLKPRSLVAECSLRFRLPHTDWSFSVSLRRSSVTADAASTAGLESDHEQL